MMPIILIVFALLLLMLLGANSIRPHCEHWFVCTGSRDYGSHRALSYECEHCGMCTSGQI